MGTVRPASGGSIQQVRRGPKELDCCKLDRVGPANLIANHTSSAGPHQIVTEIRGQLSPGFPVPRFPPNFHFIVHRRTNQQAEVGGQTGRFLMFM